MTSAAEGVVGDYLRRMAEIHGTGGATAETSYYGALENLLNAIGQTLRPRVVCNGQLRDLGAGHPDFGLYAQSQLRGERLKNDQLNKPERGVVEVKGLAEDAWKTADAAQVSQYLNAYGLILVTNYRDFLLVGKDGSDRPVKLESFSLAPDESAFWQATWRARATAEVRGGALVEYLVRVMSYRTSLTEPKDVAWFLSSYARDALDRIERRAGSSGLRQLRSALQDTLEIRFEGERGDHLFHSTLVQTLFYGVFSAWVLWAQEPDGNPRFDWRLAGWYLHVPMIEALFGLIATRQRLEDFDLVEVLNWTADVLNRIDRRAFFSRFEEEDAVAYFYEPFLEAFDPKLRDQLGVWFTPRELVRYMVERVDQALREELDIADGLADDRVHVLDPCCGTGAYLTEVLRKIDDTLVTRGLGSLRGQQVKSAALSRIYGFEILPAPFVIAHLQVGRLLQRLQASLTEDERVQVYLSNALTGWEESDLERQTEAYPDFDRERELAREIKRERRILVILGNPPYNGYPGATIEDERNLIQLYRRVSLSLGRWCTPEGQGLNDLYVRFFRTAERKIINGTGRGVVCLISNSSWLTGSSHPGMREHLLRSFNSIRIDNLHGNRKISEYAPDGRTSETVFSIRGRSVGIKVGTAIATLVAHGQDSASGMATVLYADFHQARAEERRRALVDNLDRGETGYQQIRPILELGLSIEPGEVASGYFSWPALTDLFPTFFAGVKTSRDAFLVSMDNERLSDRVAHYLDPTISHEEMRRRYPSVMTSAKRYNAENVRDVLRRRKTPSGKVVRYAYRPFDLRWLYWVGETKLLDEKRSEYWPHVFEGNSAMLLPEHHRRDWSKPQVTRRIADINVLDGSCTVFPLMVREMHAEYGSERAEVRPNLSGPAQKFLDDRGARPTDLFCHAAAVMHAPTYGEENAVALRRIWPRLPLSGDAETLRVSAVLGEELIRLLDPEEEVPGVTAGSLRPELAAIAVPTKRGGGGLATTPWHSPRTGATGMAGAR